MIAERIRRSLAASDLAGPGTAAVDPRNMVTVSCGISEFREGDDLDNMLFRSDQALYLCKDRGGNCVEKDA
jgi:PleD family two-component response regulator